MADFSFVDKPIRLHERLAREMLLVHQAGSVKVGELVRYTLTYTPSSDRILPTPSHLHLRIKNTSAIPLRAAWVHGPYALHVATYPSTFNPHLKQQADDQKQYGTPEFEPMLKAGGSWHAKLTVPEAIRETGADLGRTRHSQQSSGAGANDNSSSMTWIIEVTSQIMFSNSASVNFEVLVGRDERSLDMGFAAVAAHGQSSPGKIKEQQTSDRERKRAKKQGNVQSAGVYSKAIRLVAEDTETLWDKPALPTWEDKVKDENKHTQDEPGKTKKRKRVHLVIITHGLHSNLGADMLFMKESIDATVAEARKEAKQRKEDARKQQSGDSGQISTQKDEGSEANAGATAPLSGGQEDLNNATEEEDDEELTIVRGFTGNAVRTENGIQYLGKRLAKYVLRLTYPDQPFLPVKKSLSRTLTDTLRSDADKAKRDGKPAHLGSSIHHPKPASQDELPYTFTSISFVGHSLGGLIQTYAIAYIHKHSPTFFAQIKPVNFIAMASPMLGLSNENPMYVKFALDFGLVGRTGQDLGLTWRPPTMAKSGWNAMIGGFGAGQKDEDKPEDPSAKPLLRILPTGPAHQVLRMFRNRTVYSNVVNDGIVPLRTSCLLFLDWRGLGKVDKARRENGLIGTMAEWGWAELTGASLSSIAPNVIAERFGADSDDSEQVKHDNGDAVPQPGENETTEDGKTNADRASLEDDAAAKADGREIGSAAPKSRPGSTASQPSKGMLDNLIDFFRPAGPKSPPQQSKKTTKAFHRAQTVHHGEDEMQENSADEQKTTSNPTMRPHMPHLKSNHGNGKRRLASRGDSFTNSEAGDLQAPPKTSIFESAGDILHPPLPSRQWITDPSSRSRTIFHDRVYHPEDIPPPPTKRSGPRLTRSFSSDASSKHSQTGSQSESPQQTTDTGSMKVEEKIARAYHRDLSWRKVLVRLEPDAHNNMIVRRMFANAYGWPVVKHLTDTHFSGSFAATTRDEDEPARERAPPMDEPVGENGEEVKEQTAHNVAPLTHNESREAKDELAGLKVTQEGIVGSWSSRSGKTLERQSSAVWDDSYFEGSDGDSDDVDERTFISRIINPMAAVTRPKSAHARPESQRSHDLPASPGSPSFTDGHRGLAPVSPNATAATSSTFDSSNVESPMLAERLVEEPPPIRPPSTAAVGLQNNLPV